MTNYQGCNDQRGNQFQSHDNLVHSYQKEWLSQNKWQVFI